MIQNDGELEIAVRHLKGYQKALEAVRQELLETNPSLFPVVSTGYAKRMEALQSDIFNYLIARPAGNPLTVRWEDVEAEAKELEKETATSTAPS